MPPAQRIVTSTHSVCPRIATVTPSTKQRTIVCRSWTVVVAAHHKAGMSVARASMRRRSAALSHGRLFSREPIVLFLQVALLPQCLLPAPFQLAGNQAIFRLDGVILPGRSIGLDLGPFQPLLPVLVEPLALPLEISQGLLVQFQSRWLNRSQHFLGDQGLEVRCRETLTRRLERFYIVIRTDIICRYSLGVVVNPHLSLASPAVDQAGQE